MKTTIFALFLVAFSCQISAQSTINTLFKQYAENPDFTTVHITSEIFNLVASASSPEDKEAMELLAGLKDLYVLTTEKNGAKLYEEACQKLNTSAYKTLLSVRDKEENVRILVKEENKKIKELLLLVGSPEEFVLLNLIGEIDLKTLNKLSKSIEIKGLEHLDKVGDKK